MAERRRIIIQTGGNPEDPLSTPHFDTEATLTARRVVPLGEQETRKMHYGNYAGRAPRPFWKHPTLLVLVGLTAIGVGVAAGFAIGIYKNRSAAATPVVTVPSSSVEKVDQGQTVEPPVPSPPQARATVPGKVEEAPVQPIEQEGAPAARDDRKADEQVEPPAVSVKKRENSDGEQTAEDREDKRAERERRREERRERRRERDDEKGFPRQIERAGRELDRIREIFEGRQP